MERILFLLDYANVQRSVSDRGLALDYEDLLRYVSDGRKLIEAHAYVPVDPRALHAMDRQIEDLWVAGYVVHTKTGELAGDTYKCDFDVEMAMDTMRFAIETRPDIIVMGSGDKDFVPLILAMRNRGVRVETLGFLRNTARSVMLQSSGFIDLETYVQVTEEHEATPHQVPTA